MMVQQISKPKGRPPHPGSPKYAAYMAQKQAYALQQAGQVVDIESLQNAVKAAGGQPIPTISVAPPKTDDEIIKTISHRFDIMRNMASKAAFGTLPALIVSGAGGTGKTYNVESVLEDAAENHGVKVNIIKAKVTPVALYCQLYQYSDKNSITVLDDADAILSDEDGLNVLKAALDSSATRKISWLSSSSALNQTGTPPSFHFHGSVIFITNVNFREQVAKGGKLSMHLEALLTRCAYLDLKLHTAREIGIWIKYIIQTTGMLIQKGLNKVQEKEVIAWMDENRANLSNLSLRTANRLADYVNMEPQNWRKLAEEMEFAD
jgi:hypothetical protein